MTAAAQPLTCRQSNIPRVLAVRDSALIPFFGHELFSSEFEIIPTTPDDLFRNAFKERFDLIITSPRSSTEQDLELLQSLQTWRGQGVKVIILAQQSTPEEVIAALRASAFALFSLPLEYGSFLGMVERALNVPLWNDEIEVVSAKPDWIALRVRCGLIAAERLLQYGHELKLDVSETVRDTILHSFRELLLNAMEHGGRFNPLLKVDVGYLRTDTMILYYLRDPGRGFDTAQAIADGQAFADDPLASVAERVEKGLRAGGFGIHLANQMLDSLVYNQYGNEVVLIKNLH